MSVTSYPLIEGPYTRDLLEQPEALLRASRVQLPAELHTIGVRVRRDPSMTVVLTGMGSSFHALHPIAILLGEAGIRATMLETSELIYYWPHLLGENSIVLAVSQSGRSAEIIRLLEMDRGRSTLIALTNDEESPLAIAANACILMKAGPESTVSCKTYLATLLLLDRVAACLAGDDLSGLSRRNDEAISGVDSYLAKWREHVEEGQVALRKVQHLVLAGRGPSLAAACTGALIIKESARFPAEGMSAAAFRHGPLEMISERMLIVAFQGDIRARALNEKLVRDVNSLGGRAVLVSEGGAPGLFTLPKISVNLQPILEVLPAQMISLALAAMQHREAGAFSRASKVTSTE